MDTPNYNPFVLEDEPINIKHELARYLPFWPWFAFCLAVGLCIAFFNLRYAPRIFETTAKIKVLDESDGLELPTSAFIFKRSNINLENEIEILTSYIISERVVRALNLSTTFYEEGTIQTSPLHRLPFEFKQLTAADSMAIDINYKIEIQNSKFLITDLRSEDAIDFKGLNTYDKSHDLPFQLRYSPSVEMPLKQLEGKTYLIHFTSIKKATLNLKAQLNIESIGEGSDLLRLVINGEDTEHSEQILNTLIATFNADGIKDRQLVSERTIDFIDDRFVFLAEELDSIEINQQDFKQRNNLIAIATDAEIGLEQRTQSEGEVFKIENQLTLAQLLERSLISDAESDLLPSNIGIDNVGINTLIAEYNLAVIKKDKLANSGGINNPTVKSAETAVTELRWNIDRSLKAYMAQLEASQKQVVSRNNRLLGRVSQMPENEKLLRGIKRQQAIKESLYVLLLQKREEAAINLAITEPSVKVVEYALSGITPISPKSPTVYAVALLGGLLLPFGVLYLMFMLDTKVHSKDDITKANSKIPVIGEIPDVKKSKDIIFTNPNDRSAVAESFRILSANVDYILPIKEGEKGKVIYCTSTIKGEGKTYISINLSLALSSINKKVLLIGADLRNPQIHTQINEDKHRPGLSNYLHDVDYNWRDSLINGFDKHPNHHIILSGEIPPNPAHLLTNGRFKTLIEEAKKDYDYIIVDTAPTILITDTMLISQLADATVYVVRADYTEKNLLKFSKELEATGKLKNVAYVINSVGASKSYGYGYNYGYNYGYGAKK